VFEIDDSYIGGVLAFVCAAIAVGSDAQGEVRTRFGRRQGMSILRCWQGYAFIVLWGAFDAILYRIFLSHHDWAERAFNIKVEENLIWTGAVVGFSAILVIRTNLATINGFQIGGELIYTYTRAALIDSLNRRRLRARRAFISEFKPKIKDLASYPNYFSSLEKILFELAEGSDRRAEIEAQLKLLKAEASNPSTPDSRPMAREGITGLVYDYFGADEVNAWARDENFGN